MPAAGVVRAEAAIVVQFPGQLCDMINDVNTSRLDFGSVVVGANFLATASKDGSGMKRTVTYRSLESTNSIGGVVWAP